MYDFEASVQVVPTFLMGIDALCIGLAKFIFAQSAEKNMFGCNILLKNVCTFFLTLFICTHNIDQLWTLIYCFVHIQVKHGQVFCVPRFLLIVTVPRPQYVIYILKDVAKSFPPTYMRIVIRELSRKSSERIIRELSKNYPENYRSIRELSGNYQIIITEL